MRYLLRQLAVVALLLAAWPAFGQAYPSKPIRLVVPFPPGSNPDVVGRIITPRLTELLGQSFVIENRAGAGGMIAGEVVARAPADGYTLLLGSTGSTILAPFTVPNPQWQWAQVFAPVGSVGFSPVVVHVRPDLPIRTMREFIDYARSNPGKLTVADGGVGGINQLAGQLTQLTASVKWLQVQHNGVPPAIQDVLGGRIDALYAQVSTTMALIKSGKLRALATMGTERLRSLPELPTVEEATGYKGLVADGFVGVFAPINTPRAIVSQLATALGKTVGDPGLAEKFEGAGTVPRSSTPQEFTQFLQRETEKWRKVIADANLKF